MPVVSCSEFCGVHLSVHHEVQGFLFHRTIKKYGKFQISITQMHIQILTMF